MAVWTTTKMMRMMIMLTSFLFQMDPVSLLLRCPVPYRVQNLLSSFEVLFDKMLCCRLAPSALFVVSVTHARMSSEEWLELGSLVTTPSCNGSSIGPPSAVL